MKGTTIALVSCMFLGIEPIFGKVLLNHMSPLVLAAISSVAAAVIMSLILGVEHKVSELWDLKGGELLVLVAVGMISGLVAQLLYVTGLSQSPGGATNAVLITRLNSLLIALMGVVFLKERLTVHHVRGTILMVTGIIVIMTNGFAQAVRPTHGDGLFIIAAFCWASANILMKKYLTRLPPEVIVVGYYGFSGAVLLAMTAGDVPATLMNPDIVTYMIGMVVLVSIIGRYLWYYSFEHTSASNVGVASLSLPLFGVLYSTTLLGEKLTESQILGGILIFAGLVVIELHMTKLEDIEHRLKRHHPHH